MIDLNYENFLNELFGKIEEIGINISGYNLDHLGYYTSSSDDYDSLKLNFLKIAEEIKESIVGERRVSIFKFNQALKYKNYLIKGIELIEPKRDEFHKSSFEHAEFVVKDLNSILEKYPNIDWDKTEIDREEYPKIQYRFDNNLVMKFHPKHIFDEALSYNN